MTTNATDTYFVGLVRELCALPVETEWVEFKVNKKEPDEIGEYLSALANSAAFVGKAHAYMVWGVEDRSHRIVGTEFSPATEKIGNEELENWLLRQLSPKIHFRFSEHIVDGNKVVVLQIPRAVQHPVQFKGQEFIRIGSYKKKLKGFPARERELWRIFDQTPFEDGIAKDRVDDATVLELLDYQAYFKLMNRPEPGTATGILGALSEDELIRPDDGGGWCILNIGAVLFARRLHTFRSLRRKRVRVVQYKGQNRIKTVREHEEPRGYASAFGELVAHINNLLPTNEIIEQALRRTVPVYPELAVRELVANALIHQDFFISGAGPMVEIFDDRMEITNPGIPLVDTERFLDTPPRSRNEALASLMRRMGICEERGSGVDKVVFETEFYQLPPPSFETVGENIRAVLFSPQSLTKMDKADRIRACYLHACLKYVRRDYLTNTSVRGRFGIATRNSATASRLIKEALEAGVIRAYEEGAARKLMKYVPYWA